jgi:mono/diheme cytochrome c family protein
MREPVKGTVSQEHYLENEEVQTGLAEDGTYALTVPKAAVDHFGNMQKTLERGQQRFNIYCTPCHDKTGSGNGAVIVRAAGSFPKPPKFSDARIKQMPDGQLYATITNGVRTMPSYAAQVPVWDRWAIVSYVRALQLSDATLSTNAPAPPEKKGP